MRCTEIGIVLVLRMQRAVTPQIARFGDRDPAQRIVVRTLVEVVPDMQNKIERVLGDVALCGQIAVGVRLAECQRETRARPGITWPRRRARMSDRTVVASA